MTKQEFIELIKRHNYEYKGDKTGLLGSVSAWYQKRTPVQLSQFVICEEGFCYTEVDFKEDGYICNVKDELVLFNQCRQATYKNCDVVSWRETTYEVKEKIYDLHIENEPHDSSWIHEYSESDLMDAHFTN